MFLKNNKFNQFLLILSEPVNKNNKIKGKLKNKISTFNNACSTIGIEGLLKLKLNFNF